MVRRYNIRIVSAVRLAGADPIKTLSAAVESRTKRLAESYSRKYPFPFNIIIKRNSAAKKTHILYFSFIRTANEINSTGYKCWCTIYTAHKRHCFDVINENYPVFY